MKRFFIIAAALLCGVAAQAQNLYIEAGYANVGYKMATKTEIIKANVNQATNGFYFGAGYEHEFSQVFALEAGLQFLYAGKKESISIIQDIDVNSKWSEMDLLVPIHAKVYVPFGSSVRGFVFAGPTLNCGLLNQIKTESIAQDLYEEFNRFQLYLGGGIGFDINKTFAVKASYNYGVLNIMKELTEYAKVNNSLIEAGIVFKF